MVLVLIRLLVLLLLLLLLLLLILLLLQPMNPIPSDNHHEVGVINVCVKITYLANLLFTMEPIKPWTYLRPAGKLTRKIIAIC